MENVHSCFTRVANIGSFHVVIFPNTIVLIFMETWGLFSYHNTVAIHKRVVRSKQSFQYK